MPHHSHINMPHRNAYISNNIHSNNINELLKKILEVHLKKISRTSTPQNSGSLQILYI